MEKYKAVNDKGELISIPFIYISRFGHCYLDVILLQNYNIKEITNRCDISYFLTRLERCKNYSVIDKLIPLDKKALEDIVFVLSKNNFRFEKTIKLVNVV